jgi:hypothetical protein
MFRVIIRLLEGSRYYRASAQTAGFPAIRIPLPFNLLFRQEADLSLLRHPITVKPVLEY